MEQAPEIHKNENPDGGPYFEAGMTFKNQISLFESMNQQERFETPSEALYGFASFIRTQSEKVLEAVRAGQTGLPEKQRDEYKLEQATAKLHAFNLANAETLHLYAEVIDESEESAELLRSMFPWLQGIDVWASKYTRNTGAIE